MTYKSVICRASCYQIVKKSSFFSEGGDFIDGGEKSGKNYRIFELQSLLKWYKF